MSTFSAARRHLFAGFLTLAISHGAALAQEAPPPQRSVSPAATPSASQERLQAPRSIQTARSDADFETMVLKAPWPVVVVFRVDWCGYCQRFEKVSKEALAAGQGRFAIVHVNPERSPELGAKWMRKKGYPETQSFVRGAPVGVAEVGAFDRAQFQDYLAKLISPRKADASKASPNGKPAGREIHIDSADAFERRVLGAKLPVVVIFKNDDSISSNRMLARARAALSRPGPAYLLAVVDSAVEDVHEDHADYSSYPELQAYRDGERWDMEALFSAGELDKNEYASYVATITQTADPCEPQISKR